MIILVVDDLRLFGAQFAAHEIVYAVNSSEGLEILKSRAAEIFEIWLDHDLGPDDTVLPVINWIEEDLVGQRTLEKLTCIRILTNNPVGYQKIRALGRYVDIEPTPKHIGLRDA